MVLSLQCSQSLNLVTSWVLVKVHLLQEAFLDHLNDPALGAQLILCWVFIFICLYILSPQPLKDRDYAFCNNHKIGSIRSIQLT